MSYFATQSSLTLGALLLILGVLTIGVALGLILSKRRVKRKLPNDDTPVEG